MLGLIWSASYHDPAYVSAVTIEVVYARRPAPVRDRWSQIARSIDYSRRLAAVCAPTLVCVGRYDPQTPVGCSEEWAAGIPGAAGDLRAERALPICGGGRALCDAGGRVPWRRQAQRARSGKHPKANGRNLPARQRMKRRSNRFTAYRMRNTGCRDASASNAAKGDSGRALK